MLPNVLVYEPHLALFTKEEPLYFYKKIVTLAQHSLNRNGCLYLEINPKFRKTYWVLLKVKLLRILKLEMIFLEKKECLKQ